MRLSDATVGQLLIPVADIHAVHATLAGDGVAFAAAPHVVHRTPTAELWLAECTDPDGNGLVLMGGVERRSED